MLSSPNQHLITKIYFNPFNLGGVFSWCYACSSVAFFAQRTFFMFDAIASRPALHSAFKPSGYFWNACIAIVL
ncbi:hypothetical protein [Nostoc sp. ChiVER01]|uniref:hypothetical protein n=1 Tax=Nostoc sp. ChiVER01 TaxID=3075382 RepID=UPI002AD309A6|nr:hypothetical protein [Nostoc sp. ChiVER01]MDZ8224838.1 hypothetical protein [Nostoc sp. ChiVER01]